jgi:hypothetical protein
MKIIAYIIAGILIFFGVIFIWGAFSPTGSMGWILIGLILIGVSFGIIWFVIYSQNKKAQQEQSTVIKIDLPANIELDKLTCKNCGGSLSVDNIKMVAGAPVVTCPYCGTSYQLTEDPKW